MNTDQVMVTVSAVIMRRLADLDERMFTTYALVHARVSA